MHSSSRRVTIREVGLRDGLQSIATVMATADKCAWLDAEYQAGVREMEATALVPPRLMPQLADAPDIIAHAQRHDDLCVAALVPNAKGAERAIELGVDKINFIMSASESHNQANVRRSRADSLADFSHIARAVATMPGEERPRLGGGISTAFGCTIEGSIDPGEVRKLAASFVDAGADELVVADTVGYGDPRSVFNVFSDLYKDFDGAAPLAGHFHDTRGLGVANVAAALDAGATIIDASLAGLGGCPHAPGATGNVVTEDVVFLCESMGFETGVDLGALIETRKILARAFPEIELFGNLAKAGAPKGFSQKRSGRS